MFTETRLVNLFPIPIWVHQLAPEPSERINRSASQVIEGFRAELSGQPLQWQTPNDLQTRPEFEELNGVIKTATSGILKHLQVEYGSFVITGCWANILSTGSPIHPRHTHPNNYLSGVYYVQVPAGGDTIMFHDPKPQTNIISPRVAAPNEYNSRNGTLMIQEGMLVMFPAWLAHSVPAPRGEGDRISISFNIMFDNFAQEISRPKWEPTGNQ
ncbi:MAG: 2OG-Fe(II) oxygenase family protein [Kiloniellales bacterium]|nr:2OG-Fe(II) oxygenase family protein [Kiloniellales bacterium]MDJ0970267.1 2OG-Fe(II) oxygenase family protein [Kiloniellales bacterium]MDJ0982627.1 2OG-Fe(II) oxygenase family protein [Kiloniellales bacterium]